MLRKELKRFQAALEVRRAELRRSIAQLEQYGKTKEDEAAADTLDRAGSSHSKDMVVRRLVAEHGLLRNIEAALVRLRDGTFGECVSCGTEINAKRLEAVPWARYCLIGQSRVERRL